MRFALLVIFLSSWVLFTIVSTATAEKAHWFLRYHKENKTFELNEEVLAKISLLKQPIKVISAIGDARVGKSTALNFVLHAWEKYEKDKEDVIEGVFETGDTYSTVTNGIWISIFGQRNGTGSIVLLDVEGVNLGNDAVTNSLSLFTALMSSGISLFCSENVNNHILHFLYMLTRLDKQVFKGRTDAKNIENFVHLHVVIRGALEPPAGKSLEDFVKYEINKRTGDDDGIDNERIAIAKYFHRDYITVSEMPVVHDGKLLSKNTSRVTEKYWKFIETLSRQFKTFPEKTTLQGTRVDGDALIQLANAFVETINNDRSWMEFGNLYVMIEKSVCDKAYDNLIVPVLKMETSSKVEKRFFFTMKEFTNQCPLDEKVQQAHKNLRNRIEELRVREREMKEEEERRRKAEWDWPNIILSTATGIGGFLLRGFLSDARLKQNITTINPSKYEVLGLREVAWVWNEDAERLGLSGEARGVIAQEVEQLYPWAVATGHDGYKRVHYAALDLLLLPVDPEQKQLTTNIDTGGSFD